MNPVKNVLRALDAVQRRHVVSAFLFAVQKKAGDDNAGTLIANLAYTSFVSVFPLLLVLVTVLGLVAGSNGSAARTIEHSAISQFPIIGNEIAHNIHALKRASTVSLIIGILGLLWGATGLSQTGMYAMEQVWNVPGVARPGFASRLWRSFAFLGVLLVSVSLTGFLSGFGLVGHRGVWLGIAAEVVSILINVASYLVAFRVLTPAVVRTRQLLPGVVFGGVLWTIVQAAGSYLVERDLKSASPVYGLFAIVLGLLAWLYLAARIAVYAAEIDAVLAYHLWPRALVQPPLTDADRRSLTLQATENVRRPEEEVSVHFDGSRQQVDAGQRESPSPDAPYARYSSDAAPPPADGR